MRVQHLDDRPFQRIRYLNAAKRGGVESQVLPILRGRAEGLPAGTDAVLLTSDLQGVVPNWRDGGEKHLLGLELAHVMSELAAAGEVPPPERVGVVLGGDLFSAPAGDERGATGDVRTVWTAFAAEFAWVTGVAGNHDEFGSGLAELQATDGVHLLDCELFEIGGVRFGGVCYIIGDPQKRGRVSEGDFLAGLDVVLRARPDVVVLHEGPSASGGRLGNPEVAKRIRHARIPLTVCGHVHWTSCLADLSPSEQVINVDSRAVLLHRA